MILIPKFKPVQQAPHQTTITCDALPSNGEETDVIPDIRHLTAFTLVDIMQYEIIVCICLLTFLLVTHTAVNS